MNHKKNVICTHQNVPNNKRDWHECESCCQYVWRAEDGGEIFFVPVIKMRESLGGLRNMILRATNASDCLESLTQFPIRTRLNLDLDYIDGNLPLNPIKKNSLSIQNRLSEISNRMEIFGLSVTRLIDDGEPDTNEPIIIHRINQNPLNLIPEFKVSSDPKIIPIPKNVDHRWSEWKIKVLNSGLFFGEELFQLQKKALKQILEYPRSFTIVGLSTGYGKTRIPQVATTLLREAEGIDNGPTLIISPLISLMDDQRRCWNEILNNKIEGSGGKKLNCKFLTSSGESIMNKKEIIGELLEDKIDVLCCSPESLLKPRSSKNKDWIEAIQEMKNPFSLLVVDEAHTIADWGASIRPEFQLLDTIKRTILRQNPNLRVLLMSATITQREDKELRRMFDVSKTMRNSGEIIRETNDSACGTRRDLMFDFKKIKKENIDLAIKEIEEARKYIVGEVGWRFNDNKKGYNIYKSRSSTVVFTRKRTDANGELKNKIMSLPSVHKIKTYTGATKNSDRGKILDEFICDDMDYLIATSAFGMGVDKKNVWLSAYLGQPYTLKGLYQAFGRTARDSSWKSSTKSKRSGICIGRFYGNSQAFNPSMQIKLSMERLFDLLTQDNVSQTFANLGYLLLDLTDNPKAGWSTSVKKNINSSKYAPQEDDCNQDEFDISDMIYSSINRNNNIEISEQNKSAEEIRNEYRSLDMHIKLRLWVLSCLERTGSISILGIHPEILGIDNSGSNISLTDSISKLKSYDKSINSSADLVNYPHPQKRLIVIRINKNIKGYSGFKHEMQLGIKLLKENHDKGVQEMNKFMNYIDNDNGCIRKIFANSVGREDYQEATCLESIVDRKQPVMPCSYCRKDSWFLDKGLFQKGPLLSTSDTLNVIQKLQTNKVKKLEKYFYIQDAKNTLYFELNIVYMMIKEEINDHYPNDGNYDLFRDKNKIGRIYINKQCIKFIDLVNVDKFYNDYKEYKFKKVNKRIEIIG